jgi:hypothetical protein
MTRLLAAGLVLERGGQPLKAWAYISLASAQAMACDATIIPVGPEMPTRMRSMTWSSCASS